MTCARRIPVREEAGFGATFTLRNPDGAVQDLTGWTFDCVLTRQAGTADLELAMATPPADGFAIFDASAGQYTMRIAPATLQAIDDTTGSFLLFGTIFGSVNGTRHLIEDLQLLVTRSPGA
jgi:hypothetical protein